MKTVGYQTLLFNMLMIMSMQVMTDTIDTVGQEPYEQCGYCHEYDGNSLMPLYPKLAAQQSEYIKKQLKDFKVGKRKGQMQATAELLTNKDINVVANYFSQQQISNTKKKTLSNDKYATAEQLFLYGDEKRDLIACRSCHGNSAQGIGLAPRLASQHKSYLIQQLNLFKTGKRRNDLSDQMQTISQKLTEQEIEVLSGYLAEFSLLDGAVVEGEKLVKRIKYFKNSKIEINTVVK